MITKNPSHMTRIFLMIGVLPEFESLQSSSLVSQRLYDIESDSDCIYDNSSLYLEYWMCYIYTEKCPEEYA